MVFILFGFGLITFGIIKFIQGVILYKPNYNMYIELHKDRNENKRQYNEYLKYLSNKQELPMDKILSVEEKEMEKKINQLIGK